MSEWPHLVGRFQLAFAFLVFVDLVTARDQLNDVRNDLDRLAEDEDHRHDDQDDSKLVFLLLFHVRYGHLVYCIDYWHKMTPLLLAE